MAESRSLSPLVVLAVTGGVLAVVAAVFWPTFRGMASIWGVLFMGVLLNFLSLRGAGSAGGQ